MSGGVEFIVWAVGGVLVVGAGGGVVVVVLLVVVVVGVDDGYEFL